MKKRNIAKTMAILAAATARVSFGQAALPTYDSISYPTGNLVSNGDWTKASLAGGVLVDSTRNLSYSGLNTTSTNGVAVLDQTTGLTKMSIPTMAAPTSGTNNYYYSFTMRLTDITNLATTTAGAFIAGFDNTRTGVATQGGAFLRLDKTGTNTYDFGIAKDSGTTASSFTGFDAATTITVDPVTEANNPVVLVVGRIALNSGAANDVASMWINPTQADWGMSEGALGTSGIAHDDSPTGTADQSIQDFFFRKSANATPTTGYLDDVRVGTTWASVVPLIWGGGTDSAYSTNGNWLTGTAPAAGRVPTFMDSSTGSHTVNLASDTTVAGMIFNSNNAYTVASTGGTLVISNADTNGAQFQVSNGFHTISGPIAGTSQFTKTGKGTLVLSNTNNMFSGGMVVNDGTLAIAAPNSLGADPGSPALALTVVQQDTTNGFGITTLRFEADMTLDANRKIQFGQTSGGGPEINTNGHNVTIAGNIGAFNTNGVALNKEGAGTLVLTGDNSQPFTTAGFVNSVNIQAGTLNVSQDIALGKSATTVIIGAATLQFGGAMTDSVRPLNLTPGSNFIDTQSFSDTWSGKISNTGGSGGFAKLGSGNLALTNTANVYTGATIVSAGLLTAGAVGSIAPSSDFTVVSGATLDLNSFNSTVASLSGGGLVTEETATLTVGGTSTGTFSGQLTGTGALIKSGTGTQVMSGTNNSYSSGTTVSAGALIATNTGALPGYNVTAAVVVNSAATMGVSAGGTGQWASADIDSLLSHATWNAGSFLGINVDAGNSFAYGGALANANPGLNKIGGGTLAITNASNAYTGATQVTGGLLHFSAAGAYGSTSGITVATGGGVGLDTGSRNSAFIGKIVTGSAASTGALSLADGTGDNGGAINFNLPAGTDGAMGDAKTIGMSIGAIGTVSYTGTISPPTTGVINLNTYALGGPNGTLVIPNANELTGANSLKATNGGTVILSAGNNFSGTTTVNGGTVLQVSNGSIGSTTLVTLDGGTLQFGDNSGADLPNVEVAVGANGGTIDTQGFNNNGYGSVVGMHGGVLTKIGTGTFSTAAGNTGGALTTLIAKQGVFKFFNEGQIQSGVTATTFTLDGGTISTNSNINWNTGSSHPITVTSNGGSMGVEGGIVVSWTGALTGSGSFTKVSTGTLVLRSAYTNTGSTNVTGGKLGLLSSAPSTSAVSVSGSGSSLELMTGGSQNRVLKTGGVTATSGGQINLQDNKMIVTTPGSLSAISSLIQAGRNTGGWDGTGIITTQTNAGSTKQLTTLGVDTAGDAGKSTFGGQAVSGTDTLVMYTYAGDANLDGSVTGDDYARIDAGFAAHSPSLAGYANGDFNYDGKINADDYFLIDKNYSAQGTSFPAAPGLDGVSAVPEPASLGLLMLAGMGLRRRRRTQA